MFVSDLTRNWIGLLSMLRQEALSEKFVASKWWAQNILGGEICWEWEKQNIVCDRFVFVIHLLPPFQPQYFTTELAYLLLEGTFWHSEFGFYEIITDWGVSNFLLFSKGEALYYFTSDIGLSMCLYTFFIPIPAVWTK